MKITHFFVVSAIMFLAACGKPTAPETPDPDALAKLSSLFTKYLQVIRKGVVKRDLPKKNQILKIDQCSS